MHPRLVVLLSLLGFAVLIAGVSLWCIQKWQATPVPHPVMAPALPNGGIVDAPQEAPVPGKSPKSEMKINIDEVCQGALMYMTFTDGAAADAFVEDCKAGKHPEVIEQYKANMNLSDGAAI